MNTILLFFALPISTIILSIVLQKILQCPILVASTFFAIFLIITYAVDPNFLIYTIAYTIIAYITATLVKIICNLIDKIGKCCNNEKIGELRNSSICNTENICRNDHNANENNIQSRLTVTTNQANPVVLLTNRNNNCRNSCGCCRR